MVEGQNDVLAHIEGVDYPASKQDLIGAAQARSAREGVVEALQVLAQERFADRDAVEDALTAGPRL
ncbi:MAG: DUF2795 domain-containing protein [Actinomycetota bacterium]|nr:DUF2795 domain-containing protein [Actinomycetota bacterium]